MTDIPYRSTTVPEPLRPIFESLCAELPEYEVWVRLEDFGRWLSAGIVNRATGVAVTIPLARSGKTRTLPLRQNEVFAVRQHLNSDEPTDLQLESQLG